MIDKILELTGQKTTPASLIASGITGIVLITIISLNIVPRINPYVIPWFFIYFINIFIVGIKNLERIKCYFCGKLGNASEMENHRCSKKPKKKL